MQKDLGWTAGSILEKLRDLNIKNRSWLEILLNVGGLRVKSRKAEGLFRKITRPNRHLAMRAVGSRSCGSDQRVCGF